MAFPAIQTADTKTGTVTSNTGTWQLTFPTNLAAGDLILVLAGVDGNPAGGTFSGASGVIDYNMQSSGNVKLVAGAKVSDGTETGNFQLNFSAGEQGGWAVFRITGWYGSGLPAATTVSGNGDGFSFASDSSTTGSPNPPNLDPANWATEDTLWIVATAVDTSRTTSAYPTNYTSNQNSLVSGGSNGATLAYATRNNAASSDNPANFTMSASDDWSSATIAIRPAGASGTMTPLTISTSATASASIVKQARATKAVSATATAVAPIKAAAKTIATSASAVGSVLKRTSKTFSVSATSSAVLTASKVMLLTLSASVGTSASVLKRISLTKSVSSGTTATLSRQTAKTLSVSATANGSVLKRAIKTLTTSASAGIIGSGGSGISILDDFNRADENPLDNGTWSSALWSASDPWRIVSNRIRPTTTSGSNVARWTTHVGSGDAVVYAQVWGVNDDNSYFNLGLRRLASNTAGYGLNVHGSFVRLDSFGPNGAVIHSPVSHTFSDGDWYALATEGNDVVGYHSTDGSSWTELIRATDTDVAIRGFDLYPSVFNSYSNASTLWVDNFGAGAGGLTAYEPIKHVLISKAASVTSLADLVTQFIAGTQVYELTLTAVATTQAAIQKAVSTTKSVSAGTSATVAKSVSVFKSVSATATASLSRAISKTLAVSAQALAVLNTGATLTYQLTLSAVATTSASLRRHVNKVQNASVSPSAALSRVVSITLGSSVTAVASVSRSVLKTLTAAVTPLADLVRFVISIVGRPAKVTLHEEAPTIVLADASPTIQLREIKLDLVAVDTESTVRLTDELVGTVELETQVL